MAAYRALVYETPEFLAYFRAATPISEIAQLNIGSRPTARTSSARIEDLRAIVSDPAALLRESAPRA